MIIIFSLLAAEPAAHGVISTDSGELDDAGENDTGT
jgi:hypothetical protein